ncbi:hypothetical protein MGG_08491 [Pyricularia oryzae 70-15]|uniref:Uncharacterized protein n=3 Tax=Pyricularia oryzae TaxID=318829 RepID=G4NAN6_PYRO7|nr:uncharacterized protein MGG_08491 [Pyricularia oryzae 70-15]EHA49679.1 hypothetical protein MGG_08491 [Pyricularia oryzae 70-15]ELQ34923.1 hypothetical protein OOU_Y34scaffold00740g1 [Pyricularia oryzae Y34]KAI7911432.1 hypothetical protein M9X92_010528 [Pyricularia oryzae]KAI7912211.1 hypothetical protein M0657_010565 [Pyricularia oryzae]
MQIKFVISCLLVGAMAAPSPSPAGTDALVQLQARTPGGSPSRAPSGSPARDSDAGSAEDKSERSRISSWLHRSPKNSASSSDDEQERPSRPPHPAPKSGHNKAGHRVHTAIASANMAGGRM